jgi:glycosyltransferase involved in cell wall biosynthesis
MVDFLLRALREHDYDPIIAHYEPYSVAPDLSVPSFRLMQRHPGHEIRAAPDDVECHAIGAWLPELEFTNYLATATWRRLMDGCAAWVSVAGDVLPATPYHQTGREFLAWVATGWHDDRSDRVAQFPMVRKILHKSVVAPTVKRLEQSLLRNGTVLSLSHYTKGILNQLARSAVVKAVLPMPIDAAFFSPQPEDVSVDRVGFCGRFTDPRKNIELLLNAVALANHNGRNVFALLAGDLPTATLQRRVAELGLSDRVQFIPYLDHTELRKLLRTLDVFVVPSHQEGLCIAALEAMACGCPVVSTRCGGPEEFVLAGETGFLVDAEPAGMADAIATIVSDRQLRARLAMGGRELVQQRYDYETAAAVFWREFASTFGQTAP